MPCISKGLCSQECSADWATHHPIQKPSSMLDGRDLNKHFKTLNTVRHLHLHKLFENPRLSVTSVTIYEANQQYQCIMSTFSYMSTVNSPIHLLCIYGINSSLRNCKLQSRFISCGKHARDRLNSLSSGDSLVLHLPIPLCPWRFPATLPLLCPSWHEVSEGNSVCLPTWPRQSPGPQRQQEWQHKSHLLPPLHRCWGGLKKQKNHKTTKNRKKKKVHI